MASYRRAARREWSVEESAIFAARRDFELLKLLAAEPDKKVLATARRLKAFKSQPLQQQTLAPGVYGVSPSKVRGFSLTMIFRPYLTLYLTHIHARNIRRCQPPSIFSSDRHQFGNIANIDKYEFQIFD